MWCPGSGHSIIVMTLGSHRGASLQIASCGNYGIWHILKVFYFLNKEDDPEELYNFKFFFFVINPLLFLEFKSSSVYSLDRIRILVRN